MVLSLAFCVAKRLAGISPDAAYRRCGGDFQRRRLFYGIYHRGLIARREENDMLETAISIRNTKRCWSNLGGFCAVWMMHAGVSALGGVMTMVGRAT